jgi:hypothetical protein
MNRRSSWMEKWFEAYLKGQGIGGWCREYEFYPGRKWRFDFAWVDYKIAVELQGGLFSGGRHNQGGAMRKEYEKMNAASREGWRVLHYCEPNGVAGMVNFVDDLKRAIETKGKLC